MKPTAEELKREFAEKRGMEEYFNEDVCRWEYRRNDEDILSDLNALLDKLMPTEEEIVKYCNRTQFLSNYPHDWQSGYDAIIWFRSRMKGTDK
jgi:hypothetical protein